MRRTPGQAEEEKPMDSFTYVTAAYGVTAVFVTVYTWSLERRLRRARIAALEARHSEGEA